MVAEVCLGKDGAVAAREVSRFAGNSRDWQQLIEMCRVVDTLLVDEEASYAPRQGNDRRLLGLKGSLNEYELDLLRQRSLAARHQKARRGELIVSAPVGYIKTDGQKLEKDPDRRVQQAIALIFAKFAELATVRQTLLWFLEHGLELPARQPNGDIVWKRPCYATVYRVLTNPAYGGAFRDRDSFTCSADCRWAAPAGGVPGPLHHRKHDEAAGRRCPLSHPAVSLRILHGHIVGILGPSGGLNQALKS
jgi:DNA invertase Pin-like site-specific DNA recombinase